MRRCHGGFQAIAYIRNARAMITLIAGREGFFISASISSAAI